MGWFSVGVGPARIGTRGFSVGAGGVRAGGSWGRKGGRRKHDPNGGLGPLPKNTAVDLLTALTNNQGVRLSGESVYLQVPQPWADKDQVFLVGFNAEGAVVARAGDFPGSMEHGWKRVRTWDIGSWEPHPVPRYNEQVAPSVARLTDGTMIDGIAFVVEAVEAPIG